MSDIVFFFPHLNAVEKQKFLDWTLYADGNGRQRHLFFLWRRQPLKKWPMSQQLTGVHLRNEPIYTKETQEAAEKTVLAG